MRGYHCQTKADVTVSVSICDGHTRLENCTTLTLQSFSGRLQTHQFHFTHLLACKARLDPPEVLAASWVQRSVGHGTCAFLLCNVPTFQPFPYGLRLAEESWQHLGSPRSSCQNALVHAHVATQRPNWPPWYEDDFWELLVCIGFLTDT